MISTSSPMPIFDGHNDILLRLMRHMGQAPERAFLQGETVGHLDLPRMRQGGFAGGLFAIFVPSDEDQGLDIDAMMSQAHYEVPLPPQLTLGAAQKATLAMASLLIRIERISRGEVAICRTAADLRRCITEGVIAAVLHIEGAEAIAADLQMLDVLYEAGLRSIGPVWSRPNVFAHGVPFKFPSSPDTGPGLTSAGEELVRTCNRLKIAIDLSHLNERGFWDVANLSEAPLIATHSNAHALCPHSRNLTDKQLDAIRERKGMVGVNFATAFVRSDGRRDANTSLEDLIRHIDYLVARLGEDHVGFGSDFDGATIPSAIGDVRGLPRLVTAMRQHGYDEALLRKICSENWIAALERTWS